MALVKPLQALQTMQFISADAGRKAMIGQWSKYDAVPGTQLAKLHHAVDDAVKGVSALEWDKTRSDPQKHQAARKITKASVAEINKARAALEVYTDNETNAKLPKLIGRLHLRLIPPRKSFGRKSVPSSCRRGAPLISLPNCVLGRKRPSVCSCDF